MTNLLRQSTALTTYKIIIFSTEEAHTVTNHPSMPPSLPPQSWLMARNMKCGGLLETCIFNATRNQCIGLVSERWRRRVELTPPHLLGDGRDNLYYFDSTLVRLS